MLTQVDELDVRRQRCLVPGSRPVSETTTWPPWAIAINRAHRFNGWFTYWPSGRSSPSPACNPIRARSGPVAPHSDDPRPSCASSTRRQRVAGGREHRRHPVAHLREHHPTVPSIAASQDLVVAGERRLHRVGCSSHRRVEPSRSVNRNVTVPVGSDGTAGTLGHPPPGSPDPGPDITHHEDDLTPQIPVRALSHPLRSCDQGLSSPSRRDRSPSRPRRPTRRRPRARCHAVGSA